MALLRREMDNNDVPGRFGDGITFRSFDETNLAESWRIVMNGRRFGGINMFRSVGITFLVYNF